jgi:spore germination protein GerM
MRRIVIVIATLAMTACGTTTANPGSVPTDPTSLPTTTTTSPPISTSTTQAGAESTTTQPAPTTTATTAPSSSTTTTAPPRKMTVAPYFFVDEAGHEGRSGPFLLPVAREVDANVAVARAALNQLLAGPSAAERQGVPGISSTIPAGVKVLGLTISEDIAVVDLSSEFGAGDASATVAQRAAQVVFTLSRFDSVAEVLFRENGKPISIQIGDGALVSRPVGIWDYLEFAGALSVETPVYRGAAGNPLRVAGFGAVFEAAFQYALTDDDGLIIEEGNAMTTNGTGWGGFDFTIRYEVDRAQMGNLIVWAYSAKDGSQIDVREYPVWLTP